MSDEAALAEKGTESRWNDYLPDPRYSYFGFQPLRHHLIRTSFGEQYVAEYTQRDDWMHSLPSDVYFAQPGKSFKKVLSLCCGFGVVEPFYTQRFPSLDYCLGLDFAPEAVKAAQKNAGDNPKLRFAVADLNNYDWPENEYDLVIANGALHHLENLESVCAGIHKSLKPGGYLYANEVTGPSRQDHRQRQIELINAASYLVPPSLRQWKVAHPYTNPDPTNPFEFGIMRGSLKSHLLNIDPTEGVRSEEVIPMLESIFADTHVHHTGGGILAYSLDRAFFTNYDDRNRAHRNLLKLLCDLEAHYIATGEIPREHAILICRKT